MQSTMTRDHTAVGDRRASAAPEPDGFVPDGEPSEGELPFAEFENTARYLISK